MNKTAMILVLAIGLVMIAGCIGEETEEEKIEMKDCGVSTTNNDSAAMCFEAEYLKCNPVKVLVVQSGMNTSLSVNKGTVSACEIDLALPEMYEGKVTCVLNTNGGIKDFSNAFKAAHSNEKCTGSEEIISFLFGTRPPMTTN